MKYTQLHEQGCIIVDSVLLHVLVNKIPLVHHSFSCVFGQYKYKLKSFASGSQTTHTSILKNFWRGT